MRFCAFIYVMFLANHMYSQEKKAYQIYSADSIQTNFGQMLDSLKTADIILFGELHNNPICHWLQLEVLQDLNADKSVILGLEMVERDNQEVFAKYLKDSITHEELDSSARLWNNYSTDYKPIIDSAKALGIPVFGTNVPRRFASQVYKQGVESLDSLSANEKGYLAPLPFPYDKELPGYKKMMDMFDDPAHANENLPKAQALKDATMAHFILQHLEKDHTFLHLNGSYHSDNYEGIVWYLKNEKPNLKVVTISSKEQDNISSLESQYDGIADFIIIIPNAMTKTY